GVDVHRVRRTAGGGCPARLRRGIVGRPVRRAGGVPRRAVPGGVPRRAVTGRVPGRSASEVITGLRAGAGAVCGLDHDVFAGRHGLERVGAPLRQGPTVSGGGLAGEGVDAFGEKRTGRRREAGGHGAHTLVVVLPEPHGTGEGGVLTSPRDALRVEIGHDL